MTVPPLISVCMCVPFANRRPSKRVRLSPSDSKASGDDGDIGDSSEEEEDEEVSRWTAPSVCIPMFTCVECGVLV